MRALLCDHGRPRKAVQLAQLPEPITEIPNEGPRRDARNRDLRTKCDPLLTGQSVLDRRDGALNIARVDMAAHFQCDHVLGGRQNFEHGTVLLRSNSITSLARPPF